MSVAKVCPSCTTPLPDHAAYCYMCGTATPQGIDAITGEIRATPGAGLTRDLDRLNRALGKNYDLGEMIGQGGFAEVFVIHDRRLKRELALKALRAELTVSVQIMERFRREAETVAALRHPHIVPIFDIGEAEGLLYIIMPLIRGESLKALLQREGPRPVREAVRILVEAADALGAAHEAGVVHRDVKPENIMLEGKGRRVQLMDFGIAKALDSKDGSGLTSTGILVGTPHYMSPEQASGEPNLDHRSDQYSLAVIGYQMVTGALPFDGESTRAILFQQMVGVPTRLADLLPDVPASLAFTIDRALSKDPADRFPSMEVFAEALVGSDPLPAALTAATTSGREPRRRDTVSLTDLAQSRTAESRTDAAPQPGRARSRWRVAVGGLVGAAVVVAGAVALSRLDSGPAPQPAGVVDSSSADSAAVASPLAVLPSVPADTGSSRRPTRTPAAQRPARTSSVPATSPAVAPPRRQPAAASTCSEAVRASAWDDAGRLCLTEAEAGSGSAGRLLAGLYARGDGLPKSDSLATVWYRRAAAAGDGQAAYHLGVMLAGSTGVQAVEREATGLLRQAAEADVEMAWPVLAERYEQGLGTGRNDSEAAFWYRKAAEQGNRAAQFNLAVMFARGRGLKKDEQQAATWLAQAAAQGHIAAQYELGMAYVRGRGVEKSDSLGLVWLERAAAQGHPEAKKESENRRRP